MIVPRISGPRSPKRKRRVIRLVVCHLQSEPRPNKAPGIFGIMFSKTGDRVGSVGGTRCLPSRIQAVIPLSCGFYSLASRRCVPVNATALDTSHPWEFLSRESVSLCGTMGCCTTGGLFAAGFRGQKLLSASKPARPGATSMQHVNCCFSVIGGVLCKRRKRWSPSFQLQSEPRPSEAPRNSKNCSEQGQIEEDGFG